MTKRKILIVEDDLQSLNLLEECLSETYEVVLAEDGNKALEKLKEVDNEHSGRVQAVVLDWMMPGLSGIDVLKILKANSRFQDIPVIMQTAKSDSADIVNGLKLGAFQYLTKPYEGTIRYKYD